MVLSHQRYSRERWGDHQRWSQSTGKWACLSPRLNSYIVLDNLKVIGDPGHREQGGRYQSDHVDDVDAQGDQMNLDSNTSINTGS